MKYFIFNQRKNHCFFIILTCLFMFAASGLLAQTANDITISATTTEASCGNNGTITVTAKNNNATFNPTFFYDVRIGPVSVLPTGYTSSNYLAGLSKGTYSVWVKATYPSGNFVEKELPNVAVTGNYVTPTILFTSPRANSLPGAPTGTINLQITGGNGPFEVTLSTPQAYDDIYASGTFRPGKYAADKKFVIEKGVLRVIDWLPPGQYSVSVKDLACGNTFGGTSVTIGSLASNFYMGDGYWGMGCDTVLVRMAYGVPTEFESYYTNLPTIQKYYQYAMVSQKQMDAAGYTASTIPETLWNSFVADPHGLPVSAYYKLPTGVTLNDLKDGGANDTDRPHLFLRLIPDSIPPNNRPVATMRASNTFRALFFDLTYDLVVNTDCKFGARVVTQPIRDYLTCHPITYTIDRMNDANNAVAQANVASGTFITPGDTYFIELPNEYRNSYFRLTAYDSSGQKWVSKILGTETEGGRKLVTPFFEAQVAFGSSCPYASGKMNVTLLKRPTSPGNGNDPLNGYTVTLVDYPPEYTPTKDMIGYNGDFSYTIPLIGTTLPNGTKVESTAGISIFGNNYNVASWPIEAGYRGGYFDIAPGIYTFKLTDGCGNSYYVYTPNYAFNTNFPGNNSPYGKPRTWYQNDPDTEGKYEQPNSPSRPVKHIAVPSSVVYQYNEPVVRTDADYCGEVRIYPFENTPILTRNGVLQSVAAIAIGYPQGLTTNAVSSSQGYLQHSYKKLIFDPTKDDPTKIYFEVTKTVADGAYKIAFYESALNNASANCFLGIIDVSVSSQSLTYDETTYVGYKCGETGVLNITAVHGQGESYTYRLYSNSTYTPEALLGEITGLTAGQPARFNFSTNLPGKEVSSFVWVKIIDAKCGDEFVARLPLYDLYVNNFATVNPNAKLCEGESLSVNLLRFESGVEATLRLPDGTLLRNGQQLEDGTVFADGVLKIPSLINKKHSGIYTIHVMATACDPEGISNDIFISVSPDELWWNEGAKNSNWHDPANWTLEDGSPANAVPAPCTIVHIPQVNDNAFYPNLDGFNANATGETGTLRDIYGNPECLAIYFHYGSQLSMPHLLFYNKAFVDYNFGVNNKGTITYQKDPIHNETFTPILPLERDRWYMLAAPLKNIVSGDFGFAGYPKSFQRIFKTQTLPIASDRTGGYFITNADFSEPFNTLGYKLSSNNNALALNVGGYNGTIGFNDHKVLNNMKGIVELPYLFTEREELYPLHRYTGGISYYRYYDEQTLIPTNKTEDAVARGEEVNRFVFENNTTKQIGGVTVNGVSSQGYSMQITGNAGTEIMIGNPFMSTMDFDKLFTANSTIIEPHYKVFVDNTWRIYDKNVTSEPESIISRGNLITPLQAVVFTLKTDNPTMLFPVDGTYNVLTTDRLLVAGNRPEGRSTSVTSTSGVLLSNTFYVDAVTSAGKSRAVLSWDFPERNSIVKTVHPDYKEQPQLFFADETSRLNAVQFEKQNRGNIPLGYFSSLQGETQLLFSGINTGTFEKVVLEDRVTGVRQDILRNNTYKFSHTGELRADRFVLHVKRFGIENIDNSILLDNNISIIMAGDQLKAEAPSDILSIEVFDLSGRKINMAGDLRSAYFNGNLSLPKGVYVVKVVLVDGQTKVEKVFSK